MTVVAVADSDSLRYLAVRGRVHSLPVELKDTEMQEGGCLRPGLRIKDVALPEQH